MQMKHLMMALLSLSFLAPAASAVQVKPGAKIVFLGDSITQAGDRAKGGYVKLVRAAITEKMPDAKVEVIGAGISGNRVPDLEKRLERDVLSKKPTIVVIYIGINDVWHTIRNRGTSKEDFRAGLNRIIDQLQAANSAVILCTPSVIGEKTDGSNKLDPLLEEYSAISREVAKEQNIEMNDLRKAFINHLKTANPENAEKGILTSDTVHLNAAGNQFVANQMLGALGMLDNAEDETEAAAEVDEKGKVLRHVVLFKFKEGTPAEKIAEIEKAFAALPSKIDAIIDFEMGTDVGIEGLSDGFTHCFLVTFKNAAGRAEYLPHPAHKEFVSLLKGHLEQPLVIDYYTDE